MPEAVQAKMEDAFGADFSSVRIHEGAGASDMGALAYTQGTDIHFAPGQYQPDTQSGQELLGHELTHVVQQSQGRVQPTTQAKGIGINDSSALEREADEMGARAARGQSVGLAGGLAGGAAGAVVQRKITLEALEAKLGEVGEASYQETLDEDTDAATANAVGDAWARASALRKPYGPPFSYQLLSKDKKYQYRPPMVKKSGAKAGAAQANYEWRSADSGDFTFNAHVTVTDIDDYTGGGGATADGAADGGASAATGKDPSGTE